MADYGFDQWLWSHGMTKSQFNEAAASARLDGETQVVEEPEHAVRKHVKNKVVITEVRTWEIKTDEWLSDEDVMGVASTVVDGEDPDTVDLTWEFV